MEKSWEMINLLTNVKVNCDLNLSCNSEFYVLILSTIGIDESGKVTNWFITLNIGKKISRE